MYQLPSTPPLLSWVGEPQLHRTSQEGQQVSKQGFSSRVLLFPTLAPPPLVLLDIITFPIWG